MSQHPVTKVGSFLSNVKDENGTGLLSHISVLLEKFDKALPNASVTLIIANPIPGTDSGEVEVISNVLPEHVPAALIELGKNLGQVNRQAKPTEVN